MRLRRRYRPDLVKMLFIGEAPPVSGRYFYQADSGLYRAMRDAFRRVDPFVSDANFLDKFQTAGCYLIDLCPYPVDQWDEGARRAHRLANEPLLSRTIKKLQPEVIVSMLRAIHRNVERAASRAGWNGRFVQLPYPGRWIRHRDNVHYRT
jgi:hypothetical protein